MSEIMEIREILNCDEISRKHLLFILKAEARSVSIVDIMDACLFMIKDSEFVQENYRREFLKSYTSAFINRIKEVKEHQTDINGSLDVKDVKEAVELLTNQEDSSKEEEGFNSSFFRIYKIISLYTTYILDEPVHPVGTPFPGGFQVKYDGKKYSCPVKERQKDNPGAVCGFCIAEQDPETL